MGTALRSLPRPVAATFESISRRRAVRMGAMALWAGVLAAVSAPFVEVNRPLDWLDDSWVVGLLMAARQGAHWGSDIVFTYGPYGILTLDRAFFSPETAVSLLAALAVHVAFVGLLAARMAAAGTPPVAWLLATGVVLLRTSFEYEAQFVIVLLLATALEQKQIGKPSAHLWGASAAALGAVLVLFKSSDAVAVLGMIGVATVVAVVRGRALVAVTMVGSLIAFLAGLWLMAGQPPSGVPAYVRGAYEVVAGFGPALSLNNFSLGPVLGAAAIAALAFVMLKAWRPANDTGSLLLLSMPVVLVAFRTNFTRDDVPHTLLFLYAAILATLLAAVTMRRPRWMAGILLLALVPFSFLGLIGGQYSQLSEMRERVATYRHIAQPAGDDQATRESIRQHYALPDQQLGVLRTGTVDVMPWDILLPYGYGLTWSPRPALQSYSAYTPYLDGMDSAHFASSGPDHIVFAYESIDNRYPLFDEPAAVQTLLAGYDVDPASDSRYLVLDRRQTPRVETRRNEGRTCGALGEPIAVPHVAGAQLFASVNVSYSVAGQMLKAVYAPPALFIELSPAGGREFRLVPATAPDGLFMTGYAESSADVAALFQGQVRAPIDSFTVTTHHRFAYGSRVCADFYSLSS